MNIPAVTVLMTAYNAEAYLVEAVESILAQTFTDFEFLIIDDASTDKTLDILKEYARQDARIRLFRNEQNMKIAASLNKGLALAAAPLIARMDADDVSFPNRLEKQFAFMQEHSDITVCGTALSIYDAPDEIWTPPTEHGAIRAKLLFGSCVWHPTTMYRKEVISIYAGGYDPSLPPAEDYDLWARLSMKSSVRFANLPEILFRYRIYRVADEYKKYSELKQQMANLVRRKLLRNIGLLPTDKEFSAHFDLAMGRTLSNKIFRFSDMWACKKWLSKLYTAAINAEELVYERETLKSEMKSRWKMLCKHSSEGTVFCLIYFCSEFHDFSFELFARLLKRTAKNILKRILKSILPVELQKKLRQQQKNLREIRICNNKKRQVISLIPALTPLKNNNVPQYIVSLTSYGKRLAKTAPYAIITLLNQTVKPDRIILWVANEDKKDIPVVMNKLIAKGLEIRFCDDIKSYKKLIPALEAFPNDYIITADDDIYYPENWFANLLSKHKENPKKIICHRAHRIKVDENRRLLPYTEWEGCINEGQSESIFPTGGAGNLYPPQCFHQDIAKRELFMKLAPQADDIWFWAMAVTNKEYFNEENPYVIIKNGYSHNLQSIDTTHEKKGDTLYNYNCLQGGNDEQLNSVIEWYPQIKDILKKITLEVF